MSGIEELGCFPRLDKSSIKRQESGVEVEVGVEEVEIEVGVSIALFCLLPLVGGNNLYPLYHEFLGLSI